MSYKRELPLREEADVERLVDAFKALTMAEARQRWVEPDLAELDFEADQVSS